MYADKSVAKVYRLRQEAVSTAVYARNRPPSAKGGQTPFEKFLKVKPYINHIVEFRCPAHVIINDRYLQKWDPRTTEGFIVGFAARINTYKVFIPSSQRVDVILGKHEEVFDRPNTAERAPDATEISIDLSTRPNQAETPVPDETNASTPGECRDSSQGPASENSDRNICTGSRLADFFRPYWSTGDQDADEERPATPSTDFMHPAEQQFDVLNEGSENLGLLVQE